MVEAARQPDANADGVMVNRSKLPSRFAAHFAGHQVPRAADQVSVPQNRGKRERKAANLSREKMPWGEAP